MSHYVKHFNLQSEIRNSNLSYKCRVLKKAYIVEHWSKNSDKIEFHTSSTNSGTSTTNSIYAGGSLKKK